MKEARALSLDMDGTLYRVRRLKVAWRLRWERGLLIALLAAREKIRHELPPENEEALLAREAELVAPSFNLSMEDAVRRIRDLREAMPAALTLGATPFRGVVSALEGAHVMGLKLAVLSDYDPREKLQNLGLDRLPWAALVSTERFGALKPHPRAFLHVAEALEVEPDEVVHIGDREDLDVTGALEAGMRAWRFERSGKKVESRAERVFGEWSVSLFQELRRIAPDR
jgi:putative hydrolase of the HAD superfamily